MTPNWQLVLSMGFRSEHVMQYVDEAMGAEMEISTPTRDGGLTFGKQRVRYALRGVRKVFLSEDELIDEWERRHAGRGGIRMNDRCPQCGYALDTEAHR